MEYTLREVTQETYEAELKRLLQEKGLHDVVEDYCDRINSLSSTLSYPVHREIQECLVDILKLIDTDNPRKKLLDGLTELRQRKPYIKYIKIEELISALEKKQNEKRDN